LFVVFQTPPAAAATKKVREGCGMPSTSATRPCMLAGPILRHRSASIIAWSIVCACTADTASAVPPTQADRNRWNRM